MCVMLYCSANVLFTQSPCVVVTPVLFRSNLPERCSCHLLWSGVRPSGWMCMVPSVMPAYSSVSVPECRRVSIARSLLISSRKMYAVAIADLQFGTPITTDFIVSLSGLRLLLMCFMPLPNSVAATSSIASTSTTVFIFIICIITVFIFLLSLCKRLFEISWLYWHKFSPYSYFRILLSNVFFFLCG